MWTTVTEAALIVSVVLFWGGTAGAQAAGAASVVKAHGTIAAIDKEDRTITFTGPRGRTLTLDVKDPSKLDAVKVGDPVVATYVEAVAVRVKKAGTAMPGATVQESRVTSPPGQTPAGAVGREIRLTGTITGVDQNAQTLSIKGPRGNEETVKVKKGKALDGVKPGDLVELTYTQALAIALDKPAE